MSAGDPMVEKDPSPIGNRLISGAAWMVAMRWGVRFIGMINTLVLVRLLTPGDFGVVAMAMIVVAFVNAFNDMGLDMALIRTQNLNETHYHTAWTLSMLLGAFNAGVLVVAAPFVANFYGDPRLEAVTIAMAALPLLNSFNNPRLADYRRDLNFSKDFSYHFVSRIVALPISISLAFYLRNYWALVGGMLAQTAIALIVGYGMRPFLPRISFGAFRELFGFSIWVQIRSVGIALSQRVDQLYVGKLIGARDLGGYQVSQEISEMATSEVVLPLGRALLPGYAKIQEQRKRLRSIFYKIFGMHVILAMALGGGLFAIAGDLIPVLLGDKWSEYDSVFRILAVAGAVTAITSSTGPILVALGKVRALAVSLWLQLGLTVAGLSFIATISGGLTDIAMIRVVVAVVVLIALIGVTLSALSGSFREVLKIFVRPTASALLMILVLKALGDVLPGTGWLRLLLEIPIGAIVYLSAILGTWHLAGHPEGAEHELIFRIRDYMSSRQDRVSATKYSRRS